MLKPRRGDYFNPHSPRGERPCELIEKTTEKDISIHTPREGSDKADKSETCKNKISIHTPREGSEAKVDMTMEHYLLKIDKMLKNIEL